MHFPPILESSRTTYFDSLTGLQNWIGRTLGGAKDQRSAWRTGELRCESVVIYKGINEVFERVAIFYGEWQYRKCIWNELMPERGFENSRSVSLHKTWCFMSRHGDAWNQETEIQIERGGLRFRVYKVFLPLIIQIVACLFWLKPWSI